jgi:hypothetical protein
MRLTLNFYGTNYTVDLPALSQKSYNAAHRSLLTNLARPVGEVKNREAICAAFMQLVRSAPKANPSDLGTI